MSNACIISNYEKDSIEVIPIRQLAYILLAKIVQISSDLIYLCWHQR